MSRHRLAALLVLTAAAVAGAATTVQAGTPTGASLLLLIPAFRAGEICGRLVAGLCVLTAAAVSLGTAAVTSDLGPPLAAGWLQWGGLALLAGLVGARSTSLREAASRPRQDHHEPPAAREAALLLRRLDTLAGAIDGGFDAPASAELLLNAVDAVVPARRRAVLVGFGNDPAVPLALRGTDRVPWQDPALDDSVLGRVWRTGKAEYGVLHTDGDSRPLLAAALRDPMGDRIGVVVLERSPDAAFDDADLEAVSEVAERHSPNLDVSLIFAALRERAGFEERERLAREMHDGIAQELVALGYRVDVLRRRASTDGSTLSGPLDELRHDFSEVLADLRLQIADLRIAVRPDQGLGAVVGARLQRFGSSTGLRVVLRLNESGFRLPAHVETMTYRLLLDLLGDARLAPGATAVDVTLDVAAPQVFLQVHHDGAIQPARRRLPRAPDDGPRRGHPRRAPLPRRRRRPDAPAPAFVRRGLAPHQGEDPAAFMNVNDVKVIIIDDHTLVRAGVARLIDSEPGLSVVGEASNVTEGADMLRRTDADVMVVDVSMPDGSGLSLVRSARSDRADLGIVVLTMHNDDETLLEALDAGASALVLKSASADEVIAAVRSAAVSPDAFTATGLAAALRRQQTVRPRLTPRETEVLMMLVGGASVGKTAKALFMSESTVKTHVGKVYDKLGAHNRAEAVMAAVRLGLVNPSPLATAR